MANAQHVNIVREGSKAIQQWRDENPNVQLDLVTADLAATNLVGANLRDANIVKGNLANADLTGADLRFADLLEADLGTANLTRSNLTGANLSLSYLIKANLSEANLTEATLKGSHLLGSNLHGSTLCGADLRGVQLTESDLSGADLSGSRVYGISAWDLNLTDANQSDLIISSDAHASITVDNLELAQFIYLLLNNQKLRHVIDTVTSKTVLILGRFTPERKAVLDAIHRQLPKQHDLIPILFDWEPSSSRNLTETVLLLSSMCRFVIVDLTDPRSAPQELTKIIPNFPSVPVRPIILAAQQEYAMFKDWDGFKNVILPPYRYKDRDQLAHDLEREILKPIRDWERATDKETSRKQQLMKKLAAAEARIAELEARLKEGPRLG